MNCRDTDDIAIHESGTGKSMLSPRCCTSLSPIYDLMNAPTERNSITGAKTT